MFSVQYTNTNDSSFQSQVKYSSVKFKIGHSLKLFSFPKVKMFITFINAYYVLNTNNIELNLFVFLNKTNTINLPKHLKCCGQLWAATII